MYHSLLDLTPFRPGLVDLLTVREWAALEISISICVILLTFAQKKYDHTFSTSGLLGFMGYVSLVLKATFAFSVLWDGVYVFAHSLAEHPRPIVTVAMSVFALQQIVHLLGRATTRRIVRSSAVAGIFPPGSSDLPLWVVLLVDTRQAILEKIHAVKAR